MSKSKIKSPYPKGLWPENRPRWKDAPKWAKWLALDDDGTWVWFENMPEITWTISGGQTHYAGTGPKHFAVREGKGKTNDT